jgi:hypothetical protein
LIQVFLGSCVSKQMLLIPSYVNCFSLYGFYTIVCFPEKCNLSTLSTFILLEFYFNRSQINTCNGFYCDQFTPNSNTKPKMWTENWSGWLAT